MITKKRMKIAELKHLFLSSNDVADRVLRPRSVLPDPTVGAKCSCKELSDLVWQCAKTQIRGGILEGETSSPWGIVELIYIGKNVTSSPINNM